jgi:hypothetical protein
MAMERQKVTEDDARLVEGLITKVRSREPILNNPEGLTDDIMNSIREIPKPDTSNITEKSGKLKAIIIVRRLLAAASVCLFLLFGYEEYVVVDKISHLEKQNAAVSQSTQYKSVLNLKKAMGVILTDQEVQNKYKALKSGKLSFKTLFKAAMYVDAAGFAPDALDLPGRFDNKVVNPIFMSILKQFDSTQNNIRQ